MSRKTKRQQQVNKILRKKGCYISQSQAETEIEAVKNEERIENKVIEDWIEGENINNWTKEDLNEFKKVEKRLITEVLHWRDNAASSIRTEMKTLDTLFLSAETLTNVILLESLRSLQPKIPSPSSSLQMPSLVTEEITRNL
ncbi:hypothetical protein C1645_825886 [Glomus cerebriforme]|uniref:Uncharacterized protein n=1 Tax=Glomus cerebriforme TaxID=658196 RepID=A0A397SRK5_9GLOM|nr:hypothetical protein C1645_825886 [Glomus cerebriforme]